jgi:hypothetical protein
VKTVDEIAEEVATLMEVAAHDALQLAINLGIEVEREQARLSSWNTETTSVVQWLEQKYKIMDLISQRNFFIVLAALAHRAELEEAIVSRVQWSNKDIPSA